jgi:hypothetical protein
MSPYRTKIHATIDASPIRKSAPYYYARGDFILAGVQESGGRTGRGRTWLKEPRGRHAHTRAHTHRLRRRGRASRGCQAALPGEDADVVPRASEAAAVRAATPAERLGPTGAARAPRKRPPLPPPAPGASTACASWCVSLLPAPPAPRGFPYFRVCLAPRVVPIAARTPLSLGSRFIHPTDSPLSLGFHETLRGLALAPRNLFPAGERGTSTWPFYLPSATWQWCKAFSGTRRDQTGPDGT